MHSFDVHPKVFAFTMLLYGQQLFLQMANPEKDQEWNKIQPILKKLNEGLSEENRIKGRQRALAFRGSEPPILSDFDDVWYIMYCISNYSVGWVGINSRQNKKELEILKYALINVAKKSNQKFTDYRSRHI
jgi:hypothetical protein